jgi:hypothetical protein
MEKFNNILKKHIVSVAKAPFSEFEAEETKPEFPCGNPPNPYKIRDSVKDLLRLNPSSKDKCAQYIKNNNKRPCAKTGSTDPDNAMPYLTFLTAKTACERYAQSVVNVLPIGTSEAEKAEARRKAMCDAINFIRYKNPGVLPGGVSRLPNPAPNGPPIVAGHMGSNLTSAFNYGFTYSCMGDIVREMDKLDELAGRQDLLC